MPTLTLKNNISNSLFGKRIYIENTDGYENLSIQFDISSTKSVLFAINTTSNKISLNGTEVYYDADGAGNNNTPTLIGTISAMVSAGTTDIPGNFDITFNQNATQNAVNDIANAITYAGESQEITLSVVNGDNLSSVTPLTTTPETTSILRHTTGNFKETSADNGTIIGSMIITLENDTFKGNNNEIITANNYTPFPTIPNGLTMVITKTDDTHATVTFTGKANANINDINNIGINFKATAFTSNIAPSEAGGNNAPVVAIDFIQVPTLTLDTTSSNTGSLFTTGEILIDNVDSYKGLSTHFNTTATNDTTFNINTTSNKISLNGNNIYYDADGTASTDASVHIGTMSKVAPITFSGSKNIEVDNNTLTKNGGGTRWTDATPNSSTGFTGDGYLSAQAGATNKTVFFGLSSVNANNNGSGYNGIEYAIDIHANGKYSVLEVLNKNTRRFFTKFTSTEDYTTSDVFTIKKTGTTIEYLKNDTVFYTSEKTSPITDTLYFDSIFYNQGATLTDIEMGPNLDITFNENATQDAVNAILNAVTYAGPSQEVTLNAVNNEGLSNVASTLTVTPEATSSLEYTDSNFNETSADDGTIAGSMIITLENDTFKGNDNEIITANNYTLSTPIPNGLTMVITKTDDTHATVTFTGKANANIDDISNIGINFKATLFTSGIAPSVTNGNNAPVIDFVQIPTLTLDTTSSNAGSLFTTGEIIIANVDSYKGLSTHFNITATNNTTFNINTTSNKISLNGNNIYYDADGTDSTDVFVHIGTMSKVAPITFAGSKNIAVNDNTLTKNGGGTSWQNATPNTSTGFMGDGYLSAQAGATNKTVFFGLSSVNANNNGSGYNGIEYAIDIDANGKYLALEVANRNNKVFSTKFTSAEDYTTSDVFSIRKTGATIEYLKNDTVFYTSEKTSPITDTLYFDSIFYNQGATLTDIKMGSGSNLGITFNENATQDAVNAVLNAVTYAGPSQEVTLNAANNEGLSNVASALTVTPSATSSLKYAVSNFKETVSDNGTIAGSMIIMLENDTFKGNDNVIIATDNYTPSTTVPNGLTMVITKTDDTHATVTFTGKATANANTDDISDIRINFEAVLFTSGIAPSETNGNNAPVVAIDFIQVPTLTLDTTSSNTGSLFTTGEILIDNVDSYKGLSTHFNTTATNDTTFNINTTSNKISLNGNNIYYDADGTANTDAFVHIGTMSKVTPITFAGSNNIKIDNNTLTKNGGGDSWQDATPNTSTGFMGDGYLSAQAGATNKTVFFGLSSVNANNNGSGFNGIEYAIDIDANGKYSVLEVLNKNTRRFFTKFTSTEDYTTSDVFTIKKTGTTIEYLKNDTVFYTSEKTSPITDTLYFDSIFYNQGATLTDIEMGLGPNLNITFNENATQDAVNAILNAVTYARPGQEITLNAINNEGLSNVASILTVTPIVSINTSIIWNNIGDDTIINASEIATTALSGTISTTGTITNITMSSITFTEVGNTNNKITINDNSKLPTITNNTWTLTNDKFASQLIEGKSYTIEINLSGNSGDTTSESTTTESILIDTTAPIHTTQPVTAIINHTGTVAINNTEAVTAYLSKNKNASTVTATTLAAEIAAGTATKVTVAAGVTANLGAANLAEGVYKVYSVDIAGNVSAASNNTITIDSTLPVQTISNIQLSVDTGIANDFITNTATQTISATLNTMLNTDETLYYRLDGTSNTIGDLTGWTQVTSNSINGTAITITNATLTTGTNKKIALKVVDIAGNENTVVEQAYTLNTSTPTLNMPIALTIEGSNEDTIVLTITFDDKVNGLTNTTDSSIFKKGNIAVTAIWSGTNDTNTRTLSYTVETAKKEAVDVNETALKNALIAGITNIAGNAFVYTANGGNIPNIDIPVVGAVDLSADSGRQSTSTTIANITTISAGVAFDANIQTPTVTDIKTIKVVLGGASLDATHAKLMLDSDRALDADIATVTDKTIGGVSGLEYSYIASSKTWTISKTSGNLTPTNVETIVEVLKLKNTDVEIQAGTRTATISYIDTAGNEGVSAMVSLKVEINRGFVINGEAIDDHSGISVSSAGDVNGDGLDDLIVGAPGFNEKQGKSYVVFGKTDTNVINLSAIVSGTGGFVIKGEAVNDWSGSSVSSAGDVNGDGLDDLIIGAYYADPSNKIDAGKSYVVFGKTDTNVINLSTIASGTGGFIIKGEAADNQSGHSVSSAGDVNGDGLDDLIVGAHGSSDYKGKTYVVFGKKNTDAINLSAITSGTGGFAINGESTTDYSGWSASSAGDVNGDGLDDLIIGAWIASPSGKNNAGKSYVVFGKTDTDVINLSAIASGTGGFVINGEATGDVSGRLVSSAGDVNGDGLDDLIVGAPYANPADKVYAGKSYVVFGKTDNTAVNLGAIASGTGGFVLNGEAAGDTSGYSASSAGDVNGDGLDDLIIGALYADPSNKNDAGKSYVVFGKTDTNAINLSAIASGTGGFVINGEAADDKSGTSVSSAGDVNGDGLDDLIVGTFYANWTKGKSYVIFGKTDTNAINLSKLGDDSQYTVDFLGDANANTLTGTSKDEIFVAGAGDDILTGNGGMDVFSAGTGNDTIIINTSNLTALEKVGAGNRANINGGGNVDTLKLDGSGLTLDLTQISNNRIKDIEKIDLTGSGHNTLKLNTNNVLDASTSTNILKVLGDSGDKVYLNNSNWATSSTTITEDGITYAVYTSSDVNSSANMALWVKNLSVGIVLNAVDLSTDSGRQSASTTIANITTISTGVAFDASIQAPTVTDIKTIKVVLGGAGLDATHDKLVLDSDQALNADIATVTDATIGAVSGLEYSYIASSKTWIISKTSDNLTTANVETIVEALKLKNTDVEIQAGTRTATISYIDAAGNEGVSAMASLKVEINRGFVINGEATDDHSGISVSSAGDVNGDGLDDLIVGAHGSSGYKGKSYVVFGKTDTNIINLSAIASGTGGFAINGEAANDWSGSSVSSAGDVNGDGLDDLIVGAYYADLSNKADAGKSYVVFGKTDTSAINLSTIASGTGGFIIKGEAADNQSGHSVSSAGDVNGDGLDDLIVGAHGNSNYKGRTYVVFSKKNTDAINLGAIASGTGGFAINGESTTDYSGWSASSAGDVNGDGLDDLIVGAWLASPSDTSYYAGKSYVVFGKTNTDVINLSAIASGTGGFVINGELAIDNSGTSVSAAGDINGDGLDDLIVGAPNANLAGKSYVVFGKTDNTAVNLSAIANGTGGFVINGEAAGDKNGYSVSSAGDVNGDGLDDLIVGALNADPSNKSNAGKSYVVFGKTDTNVINLSAIASGTGGFVINGEMANDRNGTSVSSAGDVNGDGLDDLIVGALYANWTKGKSYVIFGKTDTNAINLSKLGDDSQYTVDFLGDANANTLTGTSKDEIFVAGAGDDILTGNGGMDVFSAGTGNDTIIINVSNITALEKVGAGNRANINGGGNVDTLKLDGSGLTLDLTQISNNRIKDIEKIDLTGSGHNTLKLNANNVLDASTSTNILKVLGDSGDKVYLNNSNWATSSTTITEDGITYAVYTSSDVNLDANMALWVNKILSVDVVSNAVDLSTDSGKQSTSTTFTNITAISAGVAFDTSIQTPTATIKSIKVVLAGAGLNTSNDKLVLDSDRALNADITTVTNTTIGGVSGLEYSYTVSDHTWTISKTSGNFGATDVKTIVEVLKLKNTDTESQVGVRTATISYVDAAGNEGSVATVSLKVEESRGFVINGEASDNTNTSVSFVASAGDVNGDGLDDLIVGANQANGKKGQSYVVFGRTDTDVINFSTIANGTGGFVINGEMAGDRSGVSVASAGDVNGDGLDDLIVGADGANGEKGKSYVVFGTADTTEINLSAIALASNAGGFVINGEGDSGWSVASAGDVNGDGLDDLIVDSWTVGLGAFGRSYVVFGKTDTNVVNLSTITSGSSGFVIYGEAKTYSGWSVSSAGDVNGDGLDDLIIGTWILSGESYVVFGKTDTNVVNLSAIASGTGGFVINGEVKSSGYSVSCAGDVNGDGLDDLIVGTKDNKSYAVFGKNNTDAINLSAIASGTGGFVINGSDKSGISVSSAGDINGDGLDDLIVGSEANKSYVVFGKNNTDAINLDAIVNGTGGFVINGAGISVSSAGDVNGDGLDDLIVGNRSQGKSYVIFGKIDTNAINLSALGDDSKYTIDFQGNANANTLTSTATNKDEIFIAGAGNDMLTGNGGMDVFSAGAGDDIIVINGSNINELEKSGAGNRANINGGGNVDTLKLDGSDLTLDFTNISNNRIKNIEKIDLTSSGGNTFKVNLNDVLDASTSTNILKVIGNSVDQVDIDTSKWTDSSVNKIEDGVIYRVYTHADVNVGANAALWIDTDLSII